MLSLVTAVLNIWSWLFVIHHGSVIPWDHTPFSFMNFLSGRMTTIIWCLWVLFQFAKNERNDVQRPRILVASNRLSNVNENIKFCNSFYYLYITSIRSLTAPNASDNDTGHGCEQTCRAVWKFWVTKYLWDEMNAWNESPEKTQGQIKLESVW